MNESEKLSEERMQFLGDILETGLTYQWFKVEYLNTNKVEAILFAESDDTGRFYEVFIGPDDVERGLSIYRRTFKTAPKGWYGHQLVLADKTNGEDGDYDAVTADMVMQLAVFGEVLFG